MDLAEYVERERREARREEAARADAEAVRADAEAVRADAEAARANAAEANLAEAKKESRTEGILETLLNLVEKGLISFTDAAKEAGLSPEEFQAKTAGMK